MKKFMSFILIGIAALGLSFGAMAGVSDAGAYLGVAQQFVGATNSHIGYTFANDIQTSAFSIQFDVLDVFGVLDEDGEFDGDDASFLLGSTFGFGLLYEYDVSNTRLDINVNTLLDEDNEYFEFWGSGARLEFDVLPNPCAEAGPCFNPDIMVFGEFGIKGEYDELPVLWGEVGFEVHL